MYVSYVFDLASAAGSGNVFVGHYVAPSARNAHVVNLQVDVLESSTTAPHLTCELHRISSVGTGGTSVTGVKRDETSPESVGSTAKKGTYTVDPTSSGVIDGANIPSGPSAAPWVVNYPLGVVKVAPSGLIAVVVSRNGASGTMAVKARLTVYEGN